MPCTDKIFPVAILGLISALFIKNIKIVKTKIKKGTDAPEADESNLEEVSDQVGGEKATVEEERPRSIEQIEAQASVEI